MDLWSWFLYRLGYHSTMFNFSTSYFSFKTWINGQTVKSWFHMLENWENYFEIMTITILTLCSLAMLKSINKNVIMMLVLFEIWIWLLIRKPRKQDFRISLKKFIMTGISWAQSIQSYNWSILFFSMKSVGNKNP